MATQADFTSGAAMAQVDDRGEFLMRICIQIAHDMRKDIELWFRNVGIAANFDKEAAEALAALGGIIIGEVIDPAHRREMLRRFEELAAATASRLAGTGKQLFAHQNGLKPSPSGGGNVAREQAVNETQQMFSWFHRMLNEPGPEPLLSAFEPLLYSILSAVRNYSPAFREVSEPEDLGLVLRVLAVLVGLHVLITVESLPKVYIEAVKGSGETVEMNVHALLDIFGQGAAYFLHSAAEKVSPPIVNVSTVSAVSH